MRCVDENFEPQQNFFGFYQASSTAAISNVIHDILLRLQLPLAYLHGQTYNEAGNMSGPQKGVQTLISENQTQVPFVHCGAHCINI
ncbi:hypothetical protein PR048_021730, partial [Dryococelus australis]